MDYELAKRLKDAGLPMPNRVRFDPLGMVDLKGKDEVWIPTLKELIEACGNGFEILYKENKYVNKRDWFFAGQADGADGGDLHSLAYPFGEGSTPSEAVANLWLNIKVKINEPAS